jgi:hypothetical protein
MDKVQKPSDSEHKVDWLRLWGMAASTIQSITSRTASGVEKWEQLLKQEIKKIPFQLSPDFW